MKLFNKNMYKQISKKAPLDDDIDEINEQLKARKEATNRIFSNKNKTKNEVPPPPPPTSTKQKEQKQEVITPPEELSEQLDIEKPDLKYQTYTELMLTHQQHSLKNIAFWLRVLTIYTITILFMIFVLYTLSLFEIL